MEDSDAGSCEEEGADSYTKEDIDFIEEVLAVALMAMCVCVRAQSETQQTMDLLESLSRKHRR